MLNCGSIASYTFIFIHYVALAKIDRNGLKDGLELVQTLW